MPWDPDRYLAFDDERFLPFRDLAALIDPTPSMDVIDLGCGTGELTRRLKDLLPGSSVLGIDNSESMLKRARQQAAAQVSFRHQDIEEVNGSWDLVFSHAALHWVEDHAGLLEFLWNLLRPGGQLAVQMPSNHDHPAQAVIGELAQTDPFREELDGFVRHSPVLPARAYAQELFKLGAGNITAYEKIYPHVLDDAKAIVEWTRGTFLLPYLERLSNAGQQAFLDSYTRRVEELFPGSPVFYGFKRVLLYGRKS